jgi:selenocysteine-specific elongation factor
VEKARGLTIVLGFAFCTLPSGALVGYVDVPGHVKFVKNMLAGVGAIDVAMLVVAANEGWMPQTEEHVRILELLGVEHGMIALTKASLVDRDTLELARLELDDRLTGSVLASWPVVVVDAIDGDGVDDVARTLDALLASAPAPRDADRPRLWVDRVFAARGAGTVVTGTLTGGAFRVDDDVVLEPGGLRARVRGIEAHHERLDVVQPGSRVALNLAGVDHHAIARGHTVVAPGQWAAVQTVDVALDLLDGERAQFPRRGRFDVHVGTGQHRAMVRLLDEGARFARVRFDVALPLAIGDHIVLRSSGRQTTVGGAEVLDVTPARRVADALARLPLPLGERLLVAKPWSQVASFAIAAGIDDAAARALADHLVEGGRARAIGQWVVAAGEIDRVAHEAAVLVDAHHGARPLDAGADIGEVARTVGVERAQLRAALDAGCGPGVVVERDVLRRPEHRGGAEHDESRRLLAALEAAPFAPPSPSEVGAAPAAAKALVRDGLAVEVDGVLFAASALAVARRRIGAAVVERGSLTVGDIRDLLGSTRKFVVPLATRLDQEGVTRRRGDQRIPGPRAAG